MATEPKKKIRIGDLLVQNAVITEDQLGTALREQKRTGRKLGRTLIDLGYVDEDSLLNILSRQLDVPFVQLRHYQFDNHLVKKLPGSRGPTVPGHCSGGTERGTAGGHGRPSGHLRLR